MFPSVMVGDIAGIVKFWAARHLAWVLKPENHVSRASVLEIGLQNQAYGVHEPLRAPLR